MLEHAFPAEYERYRKSTPRFYRALVLLALLQCALVVCQQVGLTALTWEAARGCTPSCELAQLDSVFVLGNLACSRGPRPSTPRPRRQSSRRERDTPSNERFSTAQQEVHVFCVACV